MRDIPQKVSLTNDKRIRDMEQYDYFKSVKEDIQEKLNDWFDDHNIEDYSCIDDIVKDVHDEFFIDDSITGNASGSYTFNSWQAEENLCHNMDLLKDALNEFGGDLNNYIDSAESCDVTIRCYVLGQVIDEVVEDFVTERFPSFEF
jgi:hypothetical protein